jgi:hypothetical protein
MTTTLSAQSIPPAIAPLREDSITMALVGLSYASSHFSHLLLPLMFPVFMKEFGWTFTGGDVDHVRLEKCLHSGIFFVPLHFGFDGVQSRQTAHQHCEKASQSTPKP